MITRPEIEARLQHLITYVRDCERRVLLGEVMDLQGLDQSIAVLCEDVLTLPETDAKEMQSQMMKLIDQLDLLAQSIKDHHSKAAS
jgi:hypothetical protein